MVTKVLLTSYKFIHCTKASYTVPEISLAWGKARGDRVLGTYSDVARSVLITARFSEFRFWIITYYSCMLDKFWTSPRVTCPISKMRWYNNRTYFNRVVIRTQKVNSCRELEQCLAHCWQSNVQLFALPSTGLNSPTVNIPLYNSSLLHSTHSGLPSRTSHFYTNSNSG